MHAKFSIPREVVIHEGIERRVTPRALIQADTFVSFRKQRHLATALDLSSGGVSLRVKASVRMEQFVQIDLFLPGLDTWINLTAEVVRGMRSGYDNIWGLMFHDLDYCSISTIDAYVRDRIDRMIPQRRQLWTRQVPPQAATKQHSRLTRRRRGNLEWRNRE